MSHSPDELPIPTTDTLPTQGPTVGATDPQTADLYMSGDVKIGVGTTYLYTAQPPSSPDTYTFLGFQFDSTVTQTDSFGDDYPEEHHVFVGADRCQYDAVNRVWSYRPAVTRPFQRNYSYYFPWLIEYAGYRWEVTALKVTAVFRSNLLVYDLASGQLVFGDAIAPDRLVSDS